MFSLVSNMAQASLISKVAVLKNVMEGYSVGIPSPVTYFRQMLDEKGQ